MKDNPKDYPIKHILSTKIIRLIRPDFVFDDFSIPATLNTLSPFSDILCSNDIAEESSTFDDMLIFPTKFGYSFT